MAELPPTGSVVARGGRRYGAVSVGYRLSTLEGEIVDTHTRATNADPETAVRVRFARKRERKLEKERDRYRKKQTAADTG